MNNKWTAAEVKFLTDNYGLMSRRAIAERLNKTYKAIDGKAQALELQGDIRHKWTDEEIKILKENFRSPINKLIELLPKHPRSSIFRKGYQLGLFRHEDTKKRLSSSNIKAASTSREHKEVMEKCLGRKLGKGETVHHINCNHNDNRCENLHLFSNGSEHAKAHWSINKLIEPLLEKGFIKFCKDKGVYELGENFPKETLDDPNQKLFWFARKITW